MKEEASEFFHLDHCWNADSTREDALYVQCNLWVHCANKVATPLKEKRESPSLVKDGKVFRCSSENHVPDIAVSEQLCVSSVPVQASCRPIAFPRCQGTGRPVARVSRLASIFRRRPLVNTRILIMSCWDILSLSQKRQHMMK